jgi:hypothetical protein
MMRDQPQRHHFPGDLIVEGKGRANEDEQEVEHRLE